MAGFDPVGPSLRWEVPLGSPRGANEVERLADLVGPVLRAGDLVCARAFQAAVGCVDAQLGTVAWTRPVGGTDAIGGDAELRLQRRRLRPDQRLSSTATGTSPGRRRR